MATLKQLKDIPTVAYLYRTKQLRPLPNEDLKPNQDYNNRIATVQYDLTKLQVDAIVNAANKSLLGGGGVDGVIHRAAGPHLLEECRTLNGCETGSAKITDAYDLPCKKVIHAVGPIYSNAQESEPKLRGCYRTALQLAVENDCKSIAFSAISTGIYGYPSKSAAKAALREVMTFLRRPEGEKLEKIVFCSFLDKDVRAYDEAIPEIFPPTEEDLSESVSTSAESEPSLENIQKDGVRGRSPGIPAGSPATTLTHVEDDCQIVEEVVLPPAHAGVESSHEIAHGQKVREADAKDPRHDVEAHSDAAIARDAELVQDAYPTVEYKARELSHDKSAPNVDAAIAIAAAGTQHEPYHHGDVRSVSHTDKERNEQDHEVESGLASTTSTETHVENELSGVLEKLTRLGSDCVHDWRLDNGKVNLGLWPKDRLRCCKCHVVACHKLF